MPFDGNGNFTRTDGTRTGSQVWQEADAASVGILADAADTHDQDIADGLENCLTLDGQNSPTAAIAWNGQDLTGVAALSITGTFTATSTDAGAAEAPAIVLHRNSATPAVNDLLGQLRFDGEDDADAATIYASIVGQILDPSDAGEDGALIFRVMTAGSLTDALALASNGTQPRLTLRSDNAGTSVGPLLVLHRDSASPADNDDLGLIAFDGEDDGGAQHTYAHITATALDVTNATEDGNLLFAVSAAGSAANRMGISASGVLIKSGMADTDVSSNALEVLETTDMRVCNITADHAAYASTAFAVRTARTANAAFNFIVAQSDYDGTPDTEFLVSGAGVVTADGTITGSGAGYAELYEWADGNPDGEDRVGCTVALSGSKIVLAQPGDGVLGVITGRPTVVGNSRGLNWVGRFELDEFNRYVLDEHGNKIQRPGFDPGREYVRRSERPEWGCVSLLGQEIVRDGQPVGSRWIKMEQRDGGVSLWTVR